METSSLSSHTEEQSSVDITDVIASSTHSEVNNVSQNNLSGPPTVQIEMVTHQTGLRNRARQTPDGLAYLTSARNHDRSSNMSNLRSIAYALVRLDVWVLDILVHSCVTTPQLVRDGFCSQFKVLVSENIETLFDYNDIYEPRFENAVQEIVEKLSDEKIMEILCDLRTSMYYSQFVCLLALLSNTILTEQNYAFTAPNLVVPKESEWLGTPQEYLKHLTIEASKIKIKQRSVVMGCQALRDRIKHAAERGEIPPTVLEALKKKMEAIQVGFSDICYMNKIEPHALIDPNLAAWWDPGHEVTQANALNSPPSKAAEAYPTSRNINSTLSFLVPTICLISCIPAGLAWFSTPSQVGSHNDSNFYQLLSSSALQLLGSGTLIWPTLFSKRLVGLPWIWTWILTGTSIICTVVSVPLYLSVPTAWSGLLSFCGNVAQALALLQLVHSL